MTYRRGTQNGRWRRYGGSETRDTADADFLGEVTTVGAEPVHVSGFIPAYQAMMVNVTEVLRGSLTAGDQVDLDVLVAAGYPHIASGQAGLPALDSAMVQPGVSVHLWANYENGRWTAIEIGTDGPQSGSYYS